MQLPAAGTTAAAARTSSPGDLRSSRPLRGEARFPRQPGRPAARELLRQELAQGPDVQLRIAPLAVEVLEEMNLASHHAALVIPEDGVQERAPVRLLRPREP